MPECEDCRDGIKHKHMPIAPYEHQGRASNLTAWESERVPRFESLA